MTLLGKNVKISLILLSLGAMLQCGCLSTIVLVNAADGAVPRSARPDSGVYSFSFTYEDRPPIAVAFRCEEYYDTQASTRGNFWAWREEGAADRSVAREVVIEDKRFGRISFKLPTCAELKDPQWSNAPLSGIMVDGKYFRHLRSSGDEHVYRHGWKPEEERTITLRFIFRMIYLPEEPPNKSPQTNAGSGPAISDEASPLHRASSSAETARTQPPRG